MFQKLMSTISVSKHVHLVIYKAELKKKGKINCMIKLPGRNTYRKMCCIQLFNFNERALTLFLFQYPFRCVCCN